MVVQHREPRGRPLRRREPDPVRFAALAFALPPPVETKARRNGLFLAALVAAGTLTAGLWPQGSAAEAPRDDIFVMEDEPPLPPPEPPPPPPMPEPPKVVPPPEEPPPPPRFGLEEGDVSETGDLAVATGNTLMKEAEPEAAPPPPPLPPAPVFMDQAPRILFAGEPMAYPPRALDRGLEGTVDAVITIDTNGAVTQVAVAKSAGAEFDQAVLKSVKSYRFQAPVQNGRKLPARFRRLFEFKLE